MIDWNQAYANGRDYRKINPDRLLEIVGIAKPKQVGKALDIGCGTGALAVMLAQMGYSVEGIDLSSVAGDLARRRAAEAGVTDKTDFHVLNISEPKQREELSGGYELITCKLVLVFIENKGEVLSWIGSQLADGGSFILITPVLHSDIDYSPRVKNISIYYIELKKLLTEHFSRVTELPNERFGDNIDQRVFVLS
jgi:protein-L-isoaspartate(D-aspartate) O-methyltransferase